MSFRQFPVHPRYIIIAFLISILILFSRLFVYQKKQAPFIVFCSVGQGNATYIRLKNNIDILIDVGPIGAIGECLQKYMPYSDKKIEYVFITHPQLDHMGGINDLLRVYKIGSMFQYCAKDKDCKHFTNVKQIVFDNKYGEYLIGDQAILSYIIPNFGEDSIDINKNTVIYHLKINKKNILITGDIPIDGLRQILYDFPDKLKSLDILLVPHHGSRTSVSIPFYRYSDPRIAIISVGKNNNYGHPSKYLIDTLKKLNIPYKRTDEVGDIFIDL